MPFGWWFYPPYFNIWFHKYLQYHKIIFSKQLKQWNPVEAECHSFCQEMAFQSKLTVASFSPDSTKDHRFSPLTLPDSISFTSLISVEATMETLFPSVKAISPPQTESQLSFFLSNLSSKTSFTSHVSHSRGLFSRQRGLVSHQSFTREHWFDQPEASLLWFGGDWHLATLSL